MRNKEMMIARLVIALSLLIGYLLAYYYSTQINKWFFKMDMTDDNMIVFSVSISICLFIGGFILGLFKRLL